MTIEQGYIGELGIRRYVGPLVVWIQELDGTFKHTLQIEHQVNNSILCLNFPYYIPLMQENNLRG